MIRPNSRLTNSVSDPLVHLPQPSHPDRESFGRPGPPVDIIWNVTRICPWNCEICCVDATHVTKRAGIITIASESLATIEKIPFENGKGSHYEQALAHVQGQGLELSLGQKLAVIDNLAGIDAKLDFSGGDVLAVGENLDVLRAASRRLGKNRVTLTATGAGLKDIDPREVGANISELNFTYDSPTITGNECRPAGYASGNIKKAAEFAKLGVATRAECPLNRDNIGDQTLRDIYRNLHEIGTNQLLVMRLFPVGRGAFRSSDVPTPNEYRRAIRVLRAEEARLGNPKIKLQCALKFFDRQDLSENPCDMVRESFGLMADGTLLASPWAVNAKGGVLHQDWVLGNLASTPLREILSSAKVQQFAGRLDENFGHCKIFSFLYSSRPDPLERMLDTSDPLYSGSTNESVA